MNVRDVAAAFLVAYLATLSIVLAMLALRMIAVLTTATWFTNLHRPAAAVTASLPSLALLGVVALVSMPLLHADAPIVPGSARALYDATPFMVARFVIYWIAWLGIDARLRAADRVERPDAIRKDPGRSRVVSSWGLIVLGVTMTFASFDWMMSLTPDWYSTVYGVYWFGGGMVGALALLAAISSRGGTDHVDVDERHALAKLLLTFVLFWVYAGFAQYIVMWSANLPREVTWYVLRARGGWGAVALLILASGVALPFLLLLLLRVKRSGRLLGSLGALLLAVHYLDTCWLVLPGLVITTWWTAALCAATLVLVIAAVVYGARVRGARNRERSLAIAR